MEGSVERKKMELTKSDAMAQISAIEQFERVKGAIDTEPEEFFRVRKELEDGSITPEEAVAQARGISESRMDYH